MRRVLAGAAAGLLLVLALRQGPASPTLAAGLSAAAPASAAAQPRAEPSRNAAAQATGPRVDSLRGTRPDGEWQLDRAGRLQPQRAVRSRFDYHLSRLGERDLNALADGLRGEAERELGVPAAAQLMDLWRRYLALLQQPLSERLDPLQPLRARALLAEQQRLRREQLGAAWAHAFYAEEEAELLAWLTSRERGAVPAPADTPPLHPQAAEREAAVQAQWRDWEGRLAQARQELAQLRAAPELSAPQREEALQRLLDTRFSPAERARARALLGI